MGADGRLTETRLEHNRVHTAGQRAFKYPGIFPFWDGWYFSILGRLVIWKINERYSFDLNLTRKVNDFVGGGEGE